MPNLTDYTINGVPYRATPDAIALVEGYALEAAVTEITDRMRQLMPALAAVELDAFEDPDCDCEPELHIYARFPATLTADDIDAALDHFDNAWWLDNAERWDYRIEVRPALA